MTPKNPQRIIFMGTPDFAVPSLKALVEAGHKILAVVTQPDRPSGRGQRVSVSAVKEFAGVLGIPVLQPERMKDPAFLSELKRLKPDFIVVVAYGKILPAEVLAIPPKGCINVHGSLLPLYRGAAPVNRAIIENETETGVTTMLLDEGMDTGPVFLVDKTEIEPDETAGELYIRLALMGGALLKKTITGIADGSLKPTPQDDARATYAPQMSKADGRVDWQKTAEEVDSFIRGVTPWPGAFTELGDKGDKTVKIHLGHPFPDDSCGGKEPGTVIETEGGIAVATGHGVYMIEELQLPNKKRMRVEELLRGFSLKAGESFK